MARFFTPIGRLRTMPTGLTRLFFPDLVPVGRPGETCFVDTATQELLVRVRNQGLAPAAGTITRLIVLPPSGSNQLTQVFDRPTPPLQAGQEVVLRFPKPVAGFIVIVDAAGNLSDEIRKDNNRLISTCTFLT